MTPAAGELQDRLAALQRAVSIGEEHLDVPEVERARAVLGRAARRLDLGLESTVVALAGATGSGKSSLFNRLAGSELAAVGVLRPTTGRVQACVWGSQDAGDLLDWLDAGRRHRVEGSEHLDGLVLLDLPDHDSTAAAHRVEVDRLVELVDLLVWVADPQKYADAALHERYLRPLAAHSSVLLVVLNRADELDGDGLAACRADLRRLLEEDGLGDVPLLITSARTGYGVEQLRAELAWRVEARRAALARLSADVEVWARRLSELCAPRATSGGVAPEDREGLVGGLADAAGVDTVADAVGRAFRHRAALAAGWPPTRWLRRFRPDPLRRWHLGAGDEGLPSLPPPGPVQQARVAGGLRDVVGRAGSALSPPWREAVRRAAAAHEPRLTEHLRLAMSGVDLGMERRPRWWAAFGLAQRALLLLAVIGALWLAVLFGFQYLRLPEPPTPSYERVPLPTALLLGGLLLGGLLAVAARLLAKSGAGRRRRTARRDLIAVVARVADELVLEPLEAELEAHSEMCDALRRAEARLPGGRLRAALRRRTPAQIE